MYIHTQLSHNRKDGGANRKAELSLHTRSQRGRGEASEGQLATLKLQLLAKASPTESVYNWRAPRRDRDECRDIDADVADGGNQG